MRLYSWHVCCVFSDIFQALDSTQERGVNLLRSVVDFSVAGEIKVIGENYHIFFFFCESCIDYKMG